MSVLPTWTSTPASQATMMLIAIASERTAPIVTTSGQLTLLEERLEAARGRPGS